MSTFTIEAPVLTPEGRTADGRIAVTPHEVQLLTGLGRSAVYAALRSGDIPSRRVGRKVLVPVAALQRLLSGESVA